MQGYVIKKNDPERCPVLIGDTQDLGKCENAVPDTIKKCEGGTPNIRFQGFSDDWEQRKLGGLCDITTGKLDANAMVQDGQFDFYTSGLDVYKIDRTAFEGPAITIAGNGASVGYMHLADGKFNAYQRTYVLTDFLADRQFLNVAIGNELPAKIQEEVRGSGIPYIVLNMLTELNIPCPSHNEQQQIGSYFRNLDNLITLHQRKCDETRELKKYMLQKMFPRDGEKVPEIRFQGFTDDWEQRKLSDLIIEYKETVDSDCTLPVLTSSKTEGVVLQEEHFGRVQNHDITGYNILPRNYCTYRNRSDGVDFTFNINRCCDKGIISKFYPVFYGNNSDIFFISMVLNYCDEVVHEIAYTCTGTGQKVLSFLDLQKMNIRVPSHDEQKKISQYFEQLDSLITLHQRKCNELKEIKQYMLQNMFP